MASKKYVIRDGFVVLLKLFKQDGTPYERRYEAGEEITLDDADVALHQHKLEFANQKDRDAALAAEKTAEIARKADMNPADLVSALTSALVQAMTAANVLPAAAAPAPAA